MDTFVYSPVDDSLLKLPPIGATVQVIFRVRAFRSLRRLCLQYKGALWETFTIDRDTFVVYDANEVYVFLLSKNQIGGERANLRRLARYRTQLYA